MIEITYITNKGLCRDRNEDALLVDNLIVQEDNMVNPISTKFSGDLLTLAVADGLGGHGYGEIASKLTLQILCEYKPTDERQIVTALRQAHHKLINYATSHPECFGFGTCIAGAIIEEMLLTIFNVGDCRVYKYTNKKLHKITRDHSYVQELIDKGIISEEEAFAHPYRNIVLESIGGIMDYRFIDVRTYKEQYCNDDIYLICSDGLFDMLDKKEIESSFAQTLDESVGNLLNKTFDKGAKDNISIILFRISKS